MAQAEQTKGRATRPMNQTVTTALKCETRQKAGSDRQTGKGA
jgi:hypothetical protein